MGRHSMRVGVLTSSRADFGIYLPLLQALKSDPFFDLEIIAFGSHLSEKFGHSSKSIIQEGFNIGHSLNTFTGGDSPYDISKSMARTFELFSELWETARYDLIFALGDRYEMFTAVASSVPFNIPVAHIHGGETTLGAIDNAFRNSITSMSKLHFTTCEKYKNRIIKIKGDSNGVYNVGALSIDLLSGMTFLTKQQFNEIYNIDLGKPTILFTFHPETINYAGNEPFILTIIETFKSLQTYQLVITMPNADTSNEVIRRHLIEYAEVNKNAFIIESFGSLGYLSCMKYCSFMLGNSSSGFVEALWFSKPVINLGKRQQGRILTSNIHSCEINMREILEAVRTIETEKHPVVEMIYGSGNAAERIIHIIKSYPFNGRSQ